MAAAFVRLADNLATSYHLDDLLQTLVETCMDVLEIAAAGMLIRAQDGKLHQVAATSEGVAHLERVQLEERAGPCFQCVHTGAPVTIADIRTDAGEWPVFRLAALDRGFASMHAVPLRLRDETIGTLNLFDIRVGALNDQDIAAARALSDVATIGILADRAARDRDAVITQLHGALDSRILIEQAKGLLAPLAGFAMTDAFSALRLFSRSRNISIHQVAAALVDTRITARDVIDAIQKRSSARHL